MKIRNERRLEIMSVMRIFMTAVLALFCPLAVFATVQVPEILNYNGKEKDMLCYPLESYLSNLEKRPDFKEHIKSKSDTPIIGSTACHRGYIGQWKIEADKLSCVKISGRGGEIEIAAIFPDKTPPVFASWYSGVLRVADGRISGSSTGLSLVYSKEIYLFISRGAVIREVSVETADMKRGIVDFDDAMSFAAKQENPNEELLNSAEFCRKQLMLYAEKFGLREKAIYVVKAGDSFASISRKYQMPIRELEELNPGVDSWKLRIGQKLNVSKLPDLDEARVLEIAKKVMTEKGSNLEDLKFSAPKQQADNSWHVFYERIPATPGAHGVIQIDEKGNFTGIIPGA